jgi:hypothetical protein
MKREQRSTSVFSWTTSSKAPFIWIAILGLFFSGPPSSFLFSENSSNPFKQQRPSSKYFIWAILAHTALNLHYPPITLELICEQLPFWGY